jgi:hypothetical protein
MLEIISLTLTATAIFLTADVIRDNRDGDDW